jgi:hypothetical protein
VDIEVLKQITRYNGFGDEPLAIQASYSSGKCSDPSHKSSFHPILSTCGEEPDLSHGISDIHQVTFKSGSSGIPETHTCFFEIDIGTYPDAADLKKKLLYGMENCKEIAETSREYQLAADFGMD